MAQGYESPPISALDEAEHTASHADGITEQAKGMFDHASDAIKDRAREAAEEQKSLGADRIDALGRAVHRAAEDLGREIPGAAAYVHLAADNLESASSALRDRSIDDVVATLSRFAQRQPAVAFAGAVVAGFALSRFLKSSAE